MQSFGGVTIEHREIDEALLLNRNTCIFGTSGTGKTVFSRYILSKLSDSNKIPSGIAFDLGSASSYEGIIPRAFIHRSLEPKVLDELLEWQKKRTKIKDLGRDHHDIDRIYAEYAVDSATNRLIDDVRAKFDSMRRQHGDQTVEPLRSKLNSTILNLKTEAIVKRFPTIEVIQNKIRNKTDQNIAMGIVLNIYILLLFDDCGGLMKDKKFKDFFEFIYARGRHYGFTTLNLIQNDTQMHKAHRDNIHTMFWMESRTLLAMSAPGRGIFSKHQVKDIERICGSNFFNRDQGEYRVLGYDRDRNCFFYVLSRNVPPRRFGNPTFWELSNAIEDLNKKIIMNQDPLGCLL